MSTHPAIVFDNLYKSYSSTGSGTGTEGQPALGPLTCSIEQGSFVSLVGPSGCGKSTALKLIAGLLAPSSGDMIVHANDDLSYVFQDATLMPWATVFDNVYLPFKLAGVPQAIVQDEVMASLDRVGLADRASAFPRELSGGMRMRVSIARALITDPKVLLMDEPFAALDEFTREKLDDDLLELWRTQKWTVLFVTHSIYESVYLSQRVMVLSQGPGKLIGDVKVNAPYPRGQAFRESTQYFDACRAVSAAMRTNPQVLS
ncbi:MAG: ABC transporter ATP-binding protein [Parvibaculaceae bacterium]|nr:ABC transporter ATP-binding protein [Parvibaculaceae bacterium]